MKLKPRERQRKKMQDKSKSRENSLRKLREPNWNLFSESIYLKLCTKMNLYHKISVTQPEQNGILWLHRNKLFKHNKTQQIKQLEKSKMLQPHLPKQLKTSVNNSY